MIPSYYQAQDTVIHQNTDTSRVVNSVPDLQINQLNTVPVSIQLPKKATTGKSILQPVKTTSEIPAATSKTTKKIWNTSSNFLINNSLTGKVEGITLSESPQYTPGTERPAFIVPEARKHLTTDWLLGIFLFLVILFVWIRIFYSKFFATLANALVSYHLSYKLFEEKNVFLHRVSIVLDFIYVIVFSVFVFEFIEYSSGRDIGIHGIRLFLLLFNIIAMYAVMRVIVLRMTGSLFLSRPLFAEYVHNTFVINKGLGIALFPVIIMAQYLPYKLVPIIFTIGILVFIAAFFLKSMRAYQIIIRRDVLLFYLILYLCTLEILPLLLGYKFVTALIQSN